MSSPAFVYTELDVSVPFASAPWSDFGSAIAQQPGFLNKTWLAGAGNHSLGGFCAFDSVENAEAFASEYLPTAAKALGVPQTSRVFEGAPVAEASRDMNSVHFGGELEQTPGAFVYTEVRTNVPFDQSPWREANPMLKEQPGFLGKTWLSCLNNSSLGGFYAFDTVENAREFAVSYFPSKASKLSAGFSTRVFDAHAVGEASQKLNSPFFAETATVSS
jgi:hypothetical protein